ncbi:Flavodoxin domain protein [uncultured archaeon]|nr:Flavodoxin domain protein [uncultured archaeon]
MAKSLIVYVSVHHGNTKRVASAISKVLGARLLELDKASVRALKDYGLLGFGSGIYHGKHSADLLKFVDKLPDAKGNRAFIFSTSGGSDRNNHAALRKKLIAKDFEVAGEFNCPGFDTYGPLQLIGGVNKGRPDAKDLRRAAEFAKGLKSKS